MNIALFINFVGTPSGRLSYTPTFLKAQNYDFKIIYDILFINSFVALLYFYNS